MRSARLAMPMSLRAMAKTLGFSHVYISDVETGKRGPGARLRERVDSLLDERWIYGGAKPK